MLGLYWLDTNSKLYQPQMSSDITKCFWGTKSPPSENHWSMHNVHKGWYCFLWQGRVNDILNFNASIWGKNKYLSNTASHVSLSTLQLYPPLNTYVESRKLYNSSSCFFPSTHCFEVLFVLVTHDISFAGCSYSNFRLLKEQALHIQPFLNLGG